MINYEEKRESLSLLLIDLSHKLRSLEEQANVPDGSYTGDQFSFDIMDRVVSGSFSILREDVNSIGALDTLRKHLQLLNFEKEKMMRMLSMSYGGDYKRSAILHYQTKVLEVRPGVMLLAEQVERSFKEKFSIENPYKAAARVIAT